MPVQAAMPVQAPISSSEAPASPAPAPASMTCPWAPKKPQYSRCGYTELEYTRTDLVNHVLQNLDPKYFANALKKAGLSSPTHL